MCGTQTELLFIESNCAVEVRLCEEEGSLGGLGGVGSCGVGGGVGAVDVAPVCC